MKAIVKQIKETQIKALQKHKPAKGAITEAEALAEIEAFKLAFDQAWVDNLDRSREVESDGFHPSALGIKAGQCGRRDVYLLRGERKQGGFSPQLIRIFANGHGVHERIQSTLESMGVDFDNEIVIKYDDPPISGHADGALTWNDERILIEIKSCNDDVFRNRLKWKKAKDEHVAQANIYCYVLGIQRMWVIYENKNTQEIAIFEAKADPAKAEKQIEKWKKSYEIFQRGELPKRPYKIDSANCLSCDLRYLCAGDAEIGV